MFWISIRFTFNAYLNTFQGSCSATSEQKKNIFSAPCGKMLHNFIHPLNNNAIIAFNLNAKNKMIYKSQDCCTVK